MSGSRDAYKALSVLGDLKALSRGPFSFLRRKIRSAAHRSLAKALRKTPVGRP